MSGARELPSPQPASVPTPDEAGPAPSEPGRGGPSRSGAGFEDAARALTPGAQPGYVAQAAQRAPAPAPAPPGAARAEAPAAAGGAGGAPVHPTVEAAEGPVAAGDLRTTGDPMDLEGNAWTFRFANPDVQACLRFLIGEWAGESAVDDLLVAPYGEDPRWVAAVRYRALKAAETPGVADPTAAIAHRLCDAVEKHGPIKDPSDPRLDPVHREALDQARRRMGTSHTYKLSKEELAKGRIDLFASGATKDGRVPKNPGTSCGLLPGAVMKGAGVMPSIKAVKGDPARLTGAAVKGMRDEAMKIGAWHAAGKTDLPRPGAPYMLSSDTAGQAIEHVGIIHALDVPDPVHGLVWTTMDAGQGGDGYCAEHVTRKVERRDDGVWLINTLPGQLGDPSKWRKVVGWVDLDAVMAAQEAQIAAAHAQPPAEKKA